MGLSVCNAEDKAKELSQDKDEKPCTEESLCNEEGCYAAVDRRDAPEGLPAFFSLAALAEVAAMENVHRYAVYFLTSAHYLVLFLSVFLSLSLFLSFYFPTHPSLQSAECAA